jgi:hypothetical protein
MKFYFRFVLSLFNSRQYCDVEVKLVWSDSKLVFAAQHENCECACASHSGTVPAAGLTLCPARKLPLINTTQFHLLMLEVALVF